MDERSGMPAFLREAMERSETVALIHDRHKGALFPHIAMLLKAFGPGTTRSIVSGAVEAVIIAAGRIGYPVGDNEILSHWRAADDDDGAILPFPEDRRG